MKEYLPQIEERKEGITNNTKILEIRKTIEFIRDTHFEEEDDVMGEKQSVGKTTKL